LKFLSRLQVPGPTSLDDAANKRYVDSVGEGGGPHALTHIDDEGDRIPNVEPYIDEQNPGAPGLMSAMDKTYVDLAVDIFATATPNGTPGTLVIRDANGFADVGSGSLHASSHIDNSLDRIPDARPYVDSQDPGAPGLMSADMARTLGSATAQGTPYTLVKRNSLGYADVGPPEKHGNEAHLVAFALNSDLALKEPAFTKNTAFNKNFGSTAGTVAKGEELGNLASLKTTAKSSLVGAVNELVDKNFVFFGTYEEWN